MALSQTQLLQRLEQTSDQRRGAFAAGCAQASLSAYGLYDSGARLEKLSKLLSRVWATLQGEILPRTVLDNAHSCAIGTTPDVDTDRAPYACVGQSASVSVLHAAQFVGSHQVQDVMDSHEMLYELVTQLAEGIGSQEGTQPLSSFAASLSGLSVEEVMDRIRHYKGEPQERFSPQPSLYAAFDEFEAELLQVIDNKNLDNIQVARQIHRLGDTFGALLQKKPGGQKRMGCD